MTGQLDILALEPFFGGPRKSMLETVIRRSRHRWTLLKLPPRRIERRLQAAAHWFAEQLSRHWAGRVDVVFTSEAMNLADLVRLVPAISNKPRVVYFHENQLPPAGTPTDNPLHIVNITTASAASEIWFNSLYHLRTFLKRATWLADQHAELSGRNLLPTLSAKAQIMPPPVDMTLSDQLRQRETIERDPRTLFVDTRDADMQLLNDALCGLYRRGEKYKLVTVGPVEGLDDDLPRRTIGERDEEARARALHESAVMVSARPGAPADYQAVRALQVGCWPIFPSTGVYPELLPSSMHHLCLYDTAHPDKLVNQLQNVWWIEHPQGYQEELDNILARYDAAAAVAAIDDRFESLAISHSLESGSE